MISIQAIQKSKTAKAVALTLAILIVTETLAPLRVYALTTGPSQPEVQSFEPVGTSEMVNAFTGDFTYNIPLLDVSGYPINLSYNSGIGMDQEASWVGLGWNINPGAITRGMRGIPDDFSGDKVTKRFNMKPNKTYGASVGYGAEVFGFDNLTGNLAYSISINYNNYRGVGFEQSLNSSFSSGNAAKGKLTGGLGVTSGSDGLNLTPSLSFARNIDNKERADLMGGGSLGLSINSRSGLKRLTLSASVTETDQYRHVKNGHVQKSTYTYSQNGNAAINFASPTYTPQVNLPMVNSSIAFSAKTGATFFGLDGTLDISGYYSEQRLERNSMDVYAYGYLNSERGAGDDWAMLDFNREKDGPFTENTPSLPLTNFSYDVYSVAGQGIGGTYRPFRSDLGHVYDARNGTYSISGNIGVEFGTGNLAHGGVDVSITDVNTVSGRWSSDNDATAALTFKGKANVSDPLYEPYYFKEAGEKSIDPEPSLFTAVGGDKPVNIRLEHTGGLNVKAHDEFKYDNQTAINIPSTNHRTSRQKRNQAITNLTVEEAKKYGLQKSFYSSGISSLAKDHHIGELTTLRADGSRYVFGLPAYNNKQVETTFNTQGRTVACSTGLVTYQSGDNSTSNTLGIDNYFSETETPAYAHSYMLTAVLSPDYVDYDNIEGPSAGDLGSYTRFNYTKASSTFKWRTPLGANSANYNEGMKSLPEDDKGSYVYGEKEIWYLSSIETKSSVAVFSLSNREDALGVADVNGTVSTASRMKKLDKITLYSKPDYDANGTNALVIKQVNFVYDYSLCDGVPNNALNDGKLTLKEVYFTYGKSFKSKLSGYKFAYADIDHDGAQDVNYNYNMKAYDRWGNYKPAQTSCTVNDPVTPAEFSYTDQDRSAEDNYSAAWSLTSIELPSGGTLNISYEADDYAYVQDKKAMQMFKITNVGYGTSYNPATVQPYQTTNGGITPVNMMGSTYSTDEYYLFFQLQETISSTTYNTSQARDLLSKYYFDGITNMYFRFLMDITSSGDYEYVSGYSEIMDYGVSTYGGGNYSYGWIKIKRVNTGDRSNSDYCNPICKAAWQFGRLHVPRKVWDEPDPQGTGVGDVIEAMANSNFAQNILEFFKGPNKTIRDKGFGQRAMMKKSWVRLLSPTGKKLGGGTRVKKITLADNWKSMINPTNNSTINSQLPTNYDEQYGQEYSYTQTDEYGRTISSGVASYEPQPGGDENPFREPVFFSEEKLLVPDDESYIEKPYGESFFPSPGVGYSRVVTKSLDRSSVPATKHASGYTVKEFYTARDFPTIVRTGNLDAQHWRTSPILSLLRITMKDYMTASQGYVIELNDMHGKPKGVASYAVGQDQPLSEVRYYYKTDPNNQKHLDNEVYAIGKNGEVTLQTSGLDYDFVSDMREQESKTLSAGLNMNLAGFLAAIFPAVVPTIFPSWSSETTRFRSAVVTKVINRYGILERTEAHDAGSTVTTENLAWDRETGELLLTKDRTNFEDAVYTFNYPAHWAYDRMGQAYRNIGAQFSGVSVSSGLATISSASSYFVKGDEVSIDNSSTHIRGWVCSATSSNVSLIDVAGTAIPNGTYDIKIIRSGRKNQQSITVGTVITRNNPLKDINSNSILDLSFEDVLHADASEFSEQWSVAPGKTSTVQCSCTLNQVGMDLAGMLNSLCANGLINTYTKLRDNATNTYYYHYTPDMYTAMSGNAVDNYWDPTLSGTNMTSKITNPVGEDCIVYIDLPASSPYTWSMVTAISNLQPVLAPSTSCPTNTRYFTATATVNYSNVLYQVPITGNTTCFDIASCGNTTTCGIQSGNTINPYYHNVLGNWRSIRSHNYFAERWQTTGATNNNLDIRNDGYYRTKNLTTGADIAFQPFWLPNSGNDWTKDATYWTWATEVTKYTPFGNEVENKDALGNYGSAVFGYNNTLPIATGNNTRQQDIGFDGFEDYAFVPTDCRELHFSFYNGSLQPDATQAHTGLYSMKLLASTSLSMTRQLSTASCTTPTANCPYTVGACDLTAVFAPYTNTGSTRTFILSYWVKENVATPPSFNYSNATIEVLINSSPVTLTLVEKSGMIEGWQRYQYKFTINNGTTGSIEFKLKNNSGSQSAWFDDIRVHPFESNMKSYVYNPVSMRFTAELDENNYAKIYEYDEEGSLIRIKKETERGIMTIREARSNLFHH